MIFAFVTENLVKKLRCALDSSGQLMNVAPVAKTDRKEGCSLSVGKF